MRPSELDKSVLDNYRECPFCGQVYLDGEEVCFCQDDGDDRDYFDEFEG